MDRAPRQRRRAADRRGPRRLPAREARAHRRRRRCSTRTGRYRYVSGVNLAALLAVATGVGGLLRAAARLAEGRLGPCRRGRVAYLALEPAPADAARALRPRAGDDGAGMRDEFLLDTPFVREFFADVRGADRREPPRRSRRAAAIRPRFAELLADPDWLPGAYLAAEPRRAAWAEASGSGCSVAPATARCRCSRSSCRRAPRRRCTTTWRGGSSASIAARRTRRSSSHEGGVLRLVERRALAPGDFYELLPPRDDIHRVRTTSRESSVSIHLLTNDTGCVWRHTYDPGSGATHPFRSGYANAPCDPSDAPRKAV